MQSASHEAPHTAEYFPAGQLSHDSALVAPSANEYFPAAHCWHASSDVAITSVENFPACTECIMFQTKRLQWSNIDLLHTPGTAPRMPRQMSLNISPQHNSSRSHSKHRLSASNICPEHNPNKNLILVSPNTCLCHTFCSQLGTDLRLPCRSVKGPAYISQEHNRCMNLGIVLCSAWNTCQLGNLCIRKTRPHPYTCPHRTAHTVHHQAHRNLVGTSRSRHLPH